MKIELEKRLFPSNTSYARDLNKEMENAKYSKIDRRKFIVVGAAVVISAAVGGYYNYTSKSNPQPTVSPTQTTKPTTPTPLGNPVADYAQEKKLGKNIVERLKVLKELNENNKALVDYLSTINDLLPSYANVEAFQLRVLDGWDGFPGILTDEKVSDEEASAVKYLTRFDKDVQLDYINFGLGEDTSRFLFINSSLSNQDFAQDVVRQKSFIRDHKLTDSEVACLRKLHDFYPTYPELAKELARLPDLNNGVDEKDMSALDKILSLASKPEYRPAFEIILNEGIKDKRKYCSPLEALMWIAYDEDIGANILHSSHLIETIIIRAWKQNPKYGYSSERWRDFKEVRDRLNSPKLLSRYMLDNISYNFKKLEDIRMGRKEGYFFQRAEDTFKLKNGICSDLARFAYNILYKNGFKYGNNREIDNQACVFGALPYDTEKESVSGHGVCLYTQNKKFYIIQTGKHPEAAPGKIKGPFNTFEEVANNIYPNWGRYIFIHHED